MRRLFYRRIDNELLRKINLVKQFPGTDVVADVGITVCIAVENDGYPVAAAQLQHGDIVFLCVQAVALRMQGTGIDFEKYMVLLCGADQGLVIDWETSVVRVADDLNSRIFHGA